MAGEPILIVDDTPVNLKLTRILLVNEGYKVLTAASAEEALELLRSHHPHVILADIQLPGIDGLEMTRRIKQDPATRDITVVAFTAFAMKGDEQRALDAGCEGYITKPIDTRTLGQRIREYLDRRPPADGAPGEPAATPAERISTAELKPLRDRFLEEGQERSRRLLLDLDGEFNAPVAARIVHQWIGTGGLLECTAISRMARELEALLLEKPLDTSQVRETLTSLALAFSNTPEIPVPAWIESALHGRVVAVVGLPAAESHRLCAALERVEARPVFFELDSTPGEALRRCSLVVTWVRPGTASSAWLDPASPAASLPNILVGSHDHVLALHAAAQSMARQVLMDSWQPMEALVRLSLAVQGLPHTQAPPAGTEHLVLIGGSDEVLSHVQAGLGNSGIDIQPMCEAERAAESIRRQRPDAAVLDLTTTGGDAYDYLSAVREESPATRILMLVPRREESEVLRGFVEGAADYLIKPFSAVELAVRLKRILGPIGPE